MTFIFLLLSLVLLLVPIILHFLTNVFGDGNFKRILWVSLGYTIIFSSVTGFLKMMEVFNYNLELTSGFIFRTLPVEQYLLHFSLSFFALTVYEYLNVRFSNNDLQKYSLAFSNLLLGLCVAFIFFGFNKWYTLTAFLVLMATLVSIEYFGKLRFMYKAYRLYLVMLVPYFIIYGVLLGAGVIIANPNEIIGLTFFKIPVETLSVFLSSLMISIYMIEYFRTNSKS